MTTDETRIDLSRFPIWNVLDHLTDMETVIGYADAMVEHMAKEPEHPSDRAVLVRALTDVAAALRKLSPA
jgi:hypothetical protein